MQSWLVGVLFGFLTSCIACASKLTIRKSWLMEDKRKAAWIRVAGMCGMSILNPMFDLVAMSYASPSLLAGFSGLALAGIVLLSGRTIGEAPSQIQVLACALIVCGQVLAMTFGDHSSDELVTVTDVKEAYFQNPLLQGYFVAMLVWLMTLCFWIQDATLPPVYQRLAWGMASGSVTGLQCFLKDALTLSKRIVFHRSDFYTPQLEDILFMAALFVLAIVIALAGLFILTASMKRYDATFANAMHSGSFVASVSLMSLVRYSTAPSGPAEYVVGLTVILLGVTTLVHSSGNGSVVPSSESKVELDSFPSTTSTTSLTVDDDLDSVQDDDMLLSDEEQNALSSEQVERLPMLDNTPIRLPTMPQQTSIMRQRSTSATYSPTPNQRARTSSASFLEMVEQSQSSGAL